MKTMGFAATSLRMCAGIIVWALHFGVLYGATAIACARGVPQAAPVIVAGATVLAVLALLSVLIIEWRQRAQFESCFAMAMAAFALLAVVWEALPVLWVPLCA